MKLNRSLSLTLLLTIFASAACSKEAAPPSSSSSSALTANNAIENIAPLRPFDRQALTVSGMITLNEFIRSDVRSRLDDEPTGDVEPGYEAAPDTSTSETQAQTESGEAREAEPAQEIGEETSATAPSDAKFRWATKAFGDAVKGKSTNTGVIVLYADENYLDIHRLMAFIEEGRSRIASRSDIPTDRFQVVYGGYRAVPQVELWVLPAGAAMPQLKTDDRSKASEPEN